MSDLEIEIEATEVDAEAVEAVAEAYAEVSNVTMGPMNMMSFEDA